MFKELICAVALSGTIGMTAPQNSNDGTYYQDVTITENYEYETNEVNSVDDLVVGNIYKIDIPFSYLNQTSPRDIIVCTFLKVEYPSISYFAYDLYDEIKVNNGTNNINIYLYQNNENINTNGYSKNSFSTENLTIYAVYKRLGDNLYLPYISASDYLGEKTITITPKEFNGLFSIFDNFLHERLFSGGILDTTNVTVFNSTLSLGQWLSTTTSIILLALIVLLLVLLIKFIFKYVGGMMIWRS